MGGWGKHILQKGNRGGQQVLHGGMGKVGETKYYIRGRETNITVEGLGKSKRGGESNITMETTS